jgi:hypothetical protein
MLNLIRAAKNNYRNYFSRIEKQKKVKNELLKKNPVLENGHDLLMDVIHLHCTSNGRTTERFSELIQSDERYDLTGFSSVFSEQTWQQKSNILSELKTNGYCILPEKLSDKQCDEVVKYALETPFTPREFQNNTFDNTILKQPYLSARYDLGSKKTLDQELFQQYIADPFFIQLATDYLGKPPVLDPVELWWSVPFGKKDDTFALKYHFDMDSIKWFKVFINFEDIDITNGPHSYLKGSHLPGTQSKKIRSKFYSRIEDEDVYENYGKENEVIFTVPKGSILIEDTKGMHKGYHVEEHRRLLLSFQYSNVIFSKPNSPFSQPQNMNDNFKKLLKKYPEFFAKYY